jgi:hypothetical protein
MEERLVRDATALDWRSCALATDVTSGERLVFATLATNEAYLREAERFAASSAASVTAFRCAAVVLSNELERAALSPRLAPVLLRGRSDWRPPREWCERHLSGWRHTSVLKLGALVLFLESGFSVLFVDADWRLTHNPLPSLRRCAASAGLELMGRRDDHFVNLGLLYAPPPAAPHTRQPAHISSAAPATSPPP